MVYPLKFKGPMFPRRPGKQPGDGKKSSHIFNWSMQRTKHGKQANIDRTHKYTIPLFAVRSAEGVRKLFSHYIKVYQGVAGAGRRNLEGRRLKAREETVAIHPDLVEAAPLGLGLDPLDCPEFFREGLLASKVIAKIFYREMIGDPIRENKKSIQALRDISRIIVRDDMLRIEYTIWSLEPNQGGRLRKTGKTFWHALPLSELRKKYATFNINWYLEICGLFGATPGDGETYLKRRKEAVFFSKFLNDYMDTYKTKSAEAKRKSLELRRDWFHGKRNDVVSVIE